MDTGAAFSIIPGIIEQKYFPELPLQKSWSLLQSYIGENLKVLGEITVQVQYGEESKSFMPRVIEGRGPMLLGQNWLKQLQLDWKTIGNIVVKHYLFFSVDQLCVNYSEAFKDKLGSIHPLKGHPRWIQRQD